jgi:dolichol-phosphate mannosyltransferase
MIKKLISIVVPVFNEELNIEYFYGEITRFIDSASKNYNFEIIFTDNHSVDTTSELLMDICNKDVRFKCVRFSKNFGYQKSILYGITRSSGDAVVQLDVDLEDSPNIILEFLNLWESGYQIVYGIRRRRSDSFGLFYLRKIFYRVINFLSDDNIPLDAGDFRLIDKKIVGLLKEMNDTQPYLRGAIASFGFKQIGVEYDRDDRRFGETKFSYMDLFKLAFDGIFNHSVVPLRLASYFAIFISIIIVILIISYSVGKIFFHYNWPSGFTTLAILSLIAILLNAVFLGIIGEYLGRIFIQLKGKVLPLVENEIGFDKK